MQLEKGLRIPYVAVNGLRIVNETLRISTAKRCYRCIIQFSTQLPPRDCILNHDDYDIITPSKNTANYTSSNVPDCAIPIFFILAQHSLVRSASIQYFPDSL